MGLSRYSVEANGLADEIGRCFSDDHKVYLGHLRAEKGDEWLLGKFWDLVEDANKFLAMPPSRQDKKLSKMRDEEAVLLLAVARAQASLASRAMTYADRIGWIVGRGYRQAAADVAADTLEARLFISADDIVARHWMPTDHQNDR